MKRTETREVKIKDLVLGHNNHVYIQSMCNIPTKQAQKVIEQILNLEKWAVRLYVSAVWIWKMLKRLKQSRKIFIYL